MSHRPPPRYRRTLTPPEPTPSGSRAPLPWAALRAAYNAHQTSTHDGRIGYRCRTCDRYSTALTHARTRDTP
jgi:hypothetical protein